MNGFSKYYYEVIKKYKVFHENGIKNQPGFSTFLGYSLTKWILKIQEIIKTNNCNSLLDFGCGKAFLYKNKFKIGDKEFTNLSDFWNLKNIYLYDPGLEEYSDYPKGKYDGIICTDVVEHIPEDDVLNFIDELFKLSNKFIFVVIATMPASKYFDDGKNIHLALKDQEEWKKIFLEFKKKYPNINQYIYFNE
tara:strand:+ start:384 stop:959 length:576 start_codon:yes stop_codon:yes gene_type:complete